MDSTAIKKLIENAKPTTSPEFYFLVGVAGLVVAWGLYLYFKQKGGFNAYRKTGVTAIDRDGEGIQPEVIRRLEGIERRFDDSISDFKTELRELRNAFGAIVHERGDLMQQIGELKGESKARAEKGH